MGWNHDPDAIHSHQSGEIHALPEKSTPVDDDLLLIEDSADSNKKKKVKVANLGGGAETLDDLTDVDTTGVADGDALVYDADTSTWVPGTGGGGGAAYHETVGDAVETTFSIEHNLDTTAVVVGVIEVSSGDALVHGVDFSWLIVDENEISVTFQSAPGNDDALIVVLASGGTSSGGGGAGDIITDWSYRNNARSTSTFAWKGNEFIPYVDIELHGMAYFGNLVAGATYQAAVATGTGSPGNIASITKSASVTLPGSLARSDGVLWFKFSSPVTLTAGTTYGLLVGRTDSTDTYALPLPFNGGADAHNAVPMPGASHGRAWRVAKANPDVGDAIDLIATNSVGAGYMFRLL